MINPELFFKITPEEFVTTYTTEESCIDLLTRLKWAGGFVCHKCGHTHFCDGKHPGSRRCTKCKTEETLKSHTIFQNCKLPLKTSMHMMLYAYHHPMSTTAEMCKQLGIRQMTCWRIKQLVKNATENEHVIPK